MSDPIAPAIAWFRRDLRLIDNPALAWAAHRGGPVIPVFVHDEEAGERPLGGASRWWLDRSLAALTAELEAKGSRLILRRGRAMDEIRRLVEETGAAAVAWNRLYEAGLAERDGDLEAGLRQAGKAVFTGNASLLLEPWEIKTKTGGRYQVFTPFWNAARPLIGGREPEPAPRKLVAPPHWPSSERLSGWKLRPAKPDWSKGFADWKPGEAGAKTRLKRFVDKALSDYPTGRDHPGLDGSSRLSPHLHWGEIGPRQAWAALGSNAAADKFRAELAWREFNHHILFDRPDLATVNLKREFDRLAWRDDPAGLEAWRRGRTGYPIVDAGMRQLWSEGFMHNRVRMIAASLLVKHLLIDWREGEAWFWDTLVDADAANNAANWQWVAGSGADAQPFFRIFNPVAQGERFDKDGAYVRRWVPELAKLPDKHIHSPWTAPVSVLDSAGVELGRDYPYPVVDAAKGRQRALDAWAKLRRG
jgi:deoxyribodipyrimidine photo-lyase